MEYSLNINVNSIEQVGVKVIDKSRLDGKALKMLLREICVMEACAHPGLVRLYEATLA